MQRNESLKDREVSLKIEIMAACRQALNIEKLSQESMAIIFQTLNPRVEGSKSVIESGTPFIMKGAAPDYPNGWE